MVLPDTSIWISYLRSDGGEEGDRLERLIRDGEVAVCGPVLAELLAGADERQSAAILETVGGLPWAGTDPGAWREVGALARRLRRGGRSLPLTDLVIAVAAARAGHLLWTLDADFERIAEELEALQLYRP